MNNTRDVKLDGLRGLAALLVGTQLCLEFFIYGRWDTAQETLPRILVYDFNISVLGAGLFWLLAGYWRAARIESARSFIVGRGMRLYPAFLIASIFAWMIAVLLHDHPAFLAVPKMLALLHVPLVQPTFAAIYGVVTVVLIFYALSLIPYMFRRAPSSRWFSGTIVVIFAAITALIVAGKLWHLHFPTRAMLGLCLTSFGAWTRLNLQRRTVVQSTIFLLATLLTCRLAWAVDWGLGELWIGQAIGFGGAILLFLTAVHRPVPRLAVLAPIGVIAFELCLVFPPLLAASLFAIDYTRLDLRLVAVAGSVAVSFPLAWALSRFVTRPAQVLVQARA